MLDRKETSTTCKREEKDERGELVRVGKRGRERMAFYLFSGGLDTNLKFPRPNFGCDAGTRLLRNFLRLAGIAYHSFFFAVLCPPEFITIHTNMYVF